jgi:hypothetical protein
MDCRVGQSCLWAKNFGCFYKHNVVLLHYYYYTYINIQYWFLSQKERAKAKNVDNNL